MNWTNYDRLVHELKTMNPHEFNYSQFFLTAGCGCVAVQAVKKCGAENSDLFCTSSTTIMNFLDVTRNEAVYIYGTSNDMDFYTSGHNVLSLKHVMGIEAALKRLEDVASRYERPTAFVPNEQAFIESCREAINEMPVLSE